MQFNYTVLENGLDFILTAINDLLSIDESATVSNENKRHIKYSLLHLSSGIELVFKHRLLHEHWIYVFEDMNKARIDKFNDGDFVSARSDVIIQRLKNYCDIKLTKAEADIIQTLRNKRNNAEHFSLKDDIPSLKNLIHDSIALLVRVILNHYNLDDFADEERKLFSEIRSLLLKTEKHYDDAIAIAQKELEQEGLESEVLVCPQCLEDFLLIDYDGNGGAKCSACTYEAQGEEAARDYIAKIMGVSEHEVATVYGRRIPLYDCPDCNDWSLVFDEENDNAICFSCGFNENCVVLLTCGNCEKQFVCVQYASDESASCPECGEDVLYEDD